MFKDSTESSPMPQGSTERKQESHHHNNTILIVEDYDRIRSFLSRHFERIGARVYSASRIIDALALTHSVVPDVIIIDYDLEHDEAIDAIRRVRQVVPGAKILVFGGVESEGVRIALREAGAADFIPNGYNLSQLDLLI